MKAINYRKYAARVTAAILGSALFALGAHANEVAVGATSRAVPYAGLDLDTTAGANVLYQRIHSAAKQVCGDNDAWQPDGAAVVKACVDQAVVTSGRSVNRQLLTRAAEAHGYGVQGSLRVAAR